MVNNKSTNGYYVAKFIVLPMATEVLFGYKMIHRQRSVIVMEKKNFFVLCETKINTSQC